jgi:hypothetical protein
MTSKALEKETNPDQLYCIVAERRIDGRRVDLTGPLSQDQTKAKNFEGGGWRMYRFFRVSKYPYKSKPLPTN